MISLNMEWMDRKRRECVAAFLFVCLFFGPGVASAGIKYTDPAGGWTYEYSGDTAAAGALTNGSFDALDGTWDANSDGSRWDGSSIGTVLLSPNLDLPGGAMTLTEGSDTFLRMQDTGDPGDHPAIPGGGTNNDNRRVGFVHDLTAAGASGTILDSGVTLSFRARIPTSSPLDEQYVNSAGGATAAWPAEGKGYPIYSGGKGMITIKQDADDSQISFSLTNAIVDNYSGPGLAMNSLNGNSPSDMVDEGEGTERLFALADPTEWHEFWVTIEAGGTGTHQVTVYADGSASGATFDVTAGSTPIADYSDVSYLGMTLSNTGEYGAADVDFVAWKSGVIAPESVPDSTTLTVDRITGAITLSNSLSSTSELEIRGYSLQSSIGALDPDNWKSIAENYDVDGPNLSDSGAMIASVDDNDSWTALTGSETHTDLSEYEFGGDGGTVGIGQSVALSEGGGWIPTPNETDLTMKLTLKDGTIVVIPVTFTGNGGLPLKRSDLNHDGDISATDWLIFQANSLEDLSGFSVAQQYSLGDLNGDGANNPHDFLLFKADYDLANGAGAFAAMIQNVPEPASLTLVVMGLCLSFALSRRRRRLSTAPVALLIAAGLFVSTGRMADAGVVASWSFDSDLTDSAGGFDGTAVNGASITNTVGEFKVGGGALALDGVDDYVTFGAAGAVTLPDNGAFTFTAWINSNHLSSPEAASGTTVLFGNDTVSQNDNWVRISDTRATLKNLTDSTNNYDLAEADYFQEGVWEHVAIVRNATEVISVYRNGAEISSTPTDGNFEGELLLSLIGAKGDGYYDGFLDELAIYDEALSSTVIAELAGVGSTSLRALIHPTTGAIVLYNNTDSPIDFNNYWLTSPANALLTTDVHWNSLDDQNYDAIGSETGESWDESGGSDASEISESFLLGFSTLDPGELVNLGAAYDTGVPEGNMTLKYHDLNDSPETLLDGIVAFIVPGDMDGSGSLEEADINPFVEALTDRASYESNYPGVPADFVGDFNDNGQLDLGDLAGFKDAIAALGSGSAGANSVPEPATAVFLSLASLGLLLNSRNR